MLTLVGTVHRDSRGEERLGHLLDRLQPGVITLELSDASLRFRRERGGLQCCKLGRILESIAADRSIPVPELEAHPTVVQIRQLLGFPFEYQAASAYARRQNIPLLLIDRPDVAVRKLAKIERELITRRNLRTLTGLPAESVGEQGEGYGVARALLGCASAVTTRQAFLAGKRGGEGIGPRDLHMATEIRRYLGACPERHLLHIGGWVHLVEDDVAGETLFSRLADLSPQRLLLDGAI